MYSCILFLGILAIFAAQAGAKKVYAIERSEIAKLAADLVKENNLTNTIEVVYSYNMF